MPKIYFGKEATRDLDKKVRLSNGYLIVHKKAGKLEGVYMVTSYRYNHNRPKNSEPGYQTTEMCTFINLESGKIQFEERCSRNTTVKRILSHLNPGIYNTEKEDYIGQELEVYKGTDYVLGIKLIEGEEIKDGLI